MRKETSNQFTEGVLSDLNPINTPNNVLTDNLNGTIITYNGNEYSLQNDMGNYELKYCKLPANYIPVGIKEYGDILYITSYNPLDGHVEIGSYPSPLMITESSEKNGDDIELKSIITEKEGNYSELMSKSESLIFNGENFKLNPGDKYWLQEDLSDLKKYETIEYSVLGEDASIHNVDDIINKTKWESAKDFRNIPWTIPGWITVKVRLAEINTFGINVRHFYVPKTDGKRTAKFSFYLKTNIDDSFIINGEDSILQQWCNGKNELGFEFKIIVNNEIIETNRFKIHDTKQVGSLELGDFEWSDWYENSRILWKNIQGTINNLNSNDIVNIEVTPFIYDELGVYTILYDNCTHKLSFDLSAIDDKPWGVGTELYQFYLNDKQDGEMIYTNIAGPLLTSFEPKLQYAIFDINNPTTPIITESEIEYKGIGENLFEIPFDDKFEKENLYVIQFSISDGKDIVNVDNRILITSEIFNDFTDRSVYDRDINFDEWINRYWDLRDDKISVNYNKPSITQKSIVFEDGDVPKNSQYWKGEKYNTFFPHIQPGLESLTLKKGYSIPKSATVFHVRKKITGPIWDDLGVIDEFKYYDYRNENWEAWDPDNFTLSKFIKATFDFNKINMPFEFIKNLKAWKFSDGVSDLRDGNSKYLYKIPESPVTIGISIYGRKFENDEYDKTFYVSGKFLDEKYTHHFKAKVDNKAALEESITDGFINDKYGSIRNWLSHILTEYKAPCLLVNVSYVLDGSSKNYKLFQTLFGAEHSSEFEFRMESDGRKQLSFIAFPGRTSAAVLIPFFDGISENIFKYFCDNISYVKTGTGWGKYDRYLLETKSIEEFLPRLTIKHIKSFDKTYSLIDWFDKSKKDLRLKTFGILEENKHILTNNTEIAFKKYETVVWDESLVDEFSKDEYPYRTIGSNKGIADLQGEIDVLNSKSEIEFEEWFNSPYYKEHRDNPIGVYCTYLTGSESLIKDMSSLFTEVEQLPMHTYDMDELPKKTEVANAVRKKFNPKEKGYNRTAWLIGHDWGDSIGKDSYVDLGGSYTDSTLVLSEKWDWLHNAF